MVISRNDFEENIFGGWIDKRFHPDISDILEFIVWFDIMII